MRKITTHAVVGLICFVSGCATDGWNKQANQPVIIEEKPIEIWGSMTNGLIRVIEFQGPGKFVEKVYDVNTKILIKTVPVIGVNFKVKE